MHPSTSLLIPIRSGDIGLDFDSCHRDACSASGTGNVTRRKCFFHVIFHTWPLHAFTRWSACFFVWSQGWWSTADLELQPGARKNLPKTPGLLILSQEEAILTNIASDSSCLRQTCQLGLTSPPAACVALGKGLFLVIDSAAFAVILAIVVSSAGKDAAQGTQAHDRAGMFCMQCNLQPSPSVPQVSSSTESDVHQPCCLHKGSRVTSASALSCKLVPSMQHFAMLVVVGTMSGPSFAIGISRGDLSTASTVPASTSHRMCDFKTLCAYQGSLQRAEVLAHLFHTLLALCIQHSVNLLQIFYRHHTCCSNLSHQHRYVLCGQILLPAVMKF